MTKIVAHRLELPSEVQFHSERRVWTLAKAEYIGWEDQVYGNPVGLLRVTEPKRYRGLVQGMSREWLPAHIRAKVPRDYPGPENKKGKEQPPIGDIELLICDMPPMKSLSDTAPQDLIDGWAMRSEFLRVHSVASLVEFLNKYGVWDHRTEPRFTSHKLRRRRARWMPENTFREYDDTHWWEPNLVAADEILELFRPDRKSESGKHFDGVTVADRKAYVNLQEFVKRALLRSPGDWFDFYHSNVEGIELRPNFPHFLIETRSCLGGIFLTITIDHLKGTAFRLCARPDCALPFAIKTRHAREYCCQYCAHLESVRRRRTEKTNARRES